MHPQIPMRSSSIPIQITMLIITERFIWYGRILWDSLLRRSIVTRQLGNGEEKYINRPIYLATSNTRLSSLPTLIFDFFFNRKIIIVNSRWVSKVQSNARFSHPFAVRMNWMNKFRFRNYRNRIFTGNLLTASYGSSNGWASVNFLELQKPDTTFPSGPLSLKEATLVMSIYFVGGFVGNLAFPYIVQRYGSKKAMLAIGFPQIVSSFTP